MAKRLLRKTLSAPGLLRVARACFDEVNDPVCSRSIRGKVNWQFTTDDARVRLKRLYPTLDE